MTPIKSPLRYPGGKSKALDQILPLIPRDFSEFREPFVGGGSVFLALKQRYPTRKFWINDLNHDLYSFWLYTQTKGDALANEIASVKRTRTDGKALFKELVALNGSLSEFDQAVRFFVLNRISFSGTVDSGGFSQKAFEQRFTDSSIQRLLNIGALLGDVKITNNDYNEALQADGDNVFIFLDPPYVSATKSRLYGKNGYLHTTFNHRRFAEDARNSPHHWLITYDDCPEIRRNFEFANIMEWNLQYGMNNYKQTSAAKGKELFISNFNFEPKELISEQFELMLC